MWAECLLEGVAGKRCEDRDLICSKHLKVTVRAWHLLPTTRLAQPLPLLPQASARTSNRVSAGLPCHKQDLYCRNASFRLAMPDR